jgi:hypothetical protein
MNLIKHIFKQHTYPAIAVILLIIIIAAIPEMQVKEIKQASVNKLATIGGSFVKKESKNTAKTYYLGEGPNNLEVAGSYNGRKTTIYKVIIKDFGKYEFSKDGEIIEEKPITAHAEEIGDGIEIKFGTISGHKPGDQWLIVATPPTYIAALSNMTGDIERTVIAIKDGTKNVLAKARGAVPAFLGSTSLTAKTIARVSNGSKFYLPASPLPPAVAAGQVERGDTALLDINIEPSTAASGKDNSGFVIFLVIIFLVIIAGLFFIIRKKKRVTNSAKKDLV